MHRWGHCPSLLNKLRTIYMQTCFRACAKAYVHTQESTQSYTHMSVSPSSLHTCTHPIKSSQQIVCFTWEIGKVILDVHRNKYECDMKRIEHTIHESHILWKVNHAHVVTHNTHAHVTVLSRHSLHLPQTLNHGSLKPTAQPTIVPNTRATGSHKALPNRGIAVGPRDHANREANDVRTWSCSWTHLVLGKIVEIC